MTEQNYHATVVTPASMQIYKQLLYASVDDGLYLDVSTTIEHPTSRRPLYRCKTHLSNDSQLCSLLHRSRRDRWRMIVVSTSE
jgi:hypothetical protein